MTTTAVESVSDVSKSGVIKHDLTPVVLLGGAANAVSVARSLGRLGAAVHVINEPGSFVRYSRYARCLEVPAAPGDEARAWTDYLLSSKAEFLRGAVLLTCCDAGLELIATHRTELSQRFLLDDSNPHAQSRMLGKLETYEDAIAAGVPTPAFRIVHSVDEVDEARRGLEFPVIIKPRLSHVFESRTGKKLFVANDIDAMAKAVSAIQATGTDSLVMELIPGGDDLLCSYYTYLDAESRPLFDFTKRIIRRYPLLQGTACYHITDWIPEAAELGNRLFRHVGLRGLGNVEFKRDPRDGQLKLIECNARFTASNCLVAQSGIDLARFVYNRLTGRPLPATDRFEQGVRLWDPIRDFQAYRALSKGGRLSFGRWLADVSHKQTFPYFNWSDPMPALARLSKPLRPRFRHASG